MSPTPLLDTITLPQDLRALSRNQLPQVAEELRAFLLESVGKTGGHFASNLGAVELTVALHYVYHTPQDKLVWDVGHQSYPHETSPAARATWAVCANMAAWRGFPNAPNRNTTLSAWASSTSIGAALGMAVADQAGGQRAPQRGHYR